MLVFKLDLTQKNFENNFMQKLLFEESSFPLKSNFSWQFQLAVYSAKQCC